MRGRVATCEEHQSVFVLKIPQARLEAYEFNFTNEHNLQQFYLLHEL